MSMNEKRPISDNEIKEAAGGKSDKWYDWSHGKYEKFGNYVVYTVAGGDVLSAIAVRFGVTVEQICEWNNIENPDILYGGQKLTIYPTTIY